MPSNHYSITSASFLAKTINKKDSDEEQTENYSMISNDHIPSMTYPSNLSMCTRLSTSSQQPPSQQLQQHPLLLVAEETEMFDNDNDKLVLPRSTRLLKRRTSLFEKSRDWVSVVLSFL